MGCVHNRIQEIARCHDGIHECVSKRFLARSRGQMVDHDNVATCFVAVSGRQQVPTDNLEPSAVVLRLELLEMIDPTARPRKAANVAKAARQKSADDTGAEKSRRSRDEDRLLGAGDRVHATPRRRGVTRTA